MSSAIAEHFKCVDDRGVLHTALKIQHFTPFRTLSGSSKVPGPYEFKLANGYDLNPTNDDETEFEIIQVEGVVRRV